MLWRAQPICAGIKLATAIVKDGSLPGGTGVGNHWINQDHNMMFLAAVHWLRPGLVLRRK